MILTLLAAACIDTPAAEPREPVPPASLNRSTYAAGTVTVTPEWWAVESAAGGGKFGTSAAVVGDLDGDGFEDVVVGAPRSAFSTDGGRLYAFLGSTDGPSDAYDWRYTSTTAGAELGTSVAAAGDVNGDGYADLVAGAPKYSHGQSTEGQVAVFLGAPAGFGAAPDTSIECNEAICALGISVSGAGDVDGDGYDDVVAGAWGRGSDGAAFLYSGGSAGTDSVAAWEATSGTGKSDLYGWSVAGGMDVNGDGYADVAVGAPYYDNGVNNQGAVFGYFGSAAGLATTADWTWESGTVSAQVASALANGGDIDGDGYDELLVGATTYDNGQTDEGAAWAFFGSASGLGAAPDWSIEGNESSAYVGSALAGGDLNGDGFGDVAIGAYKLDYSRSDSGVVLLYTGSASGLATTPDSAFTATGDQVGAAVSAGDVNDDGHPDLLVTNSSTSGTAWLLTGSTTGVERTESWAAAISGSCAYVANAGDIDGDGFDDVVVGEGASEAYLFPGSPAGIVTTSAVTLGEGGASAVSFGYAVDGAGDVNGDGFGDVVVGDYGYTATASGEGALFVFEGSAVGLSATPSSTVESGTAYVELGFSVAGVGDVDGDGFDDVAGGADGYEDGEVGEGALFVYGGSGSGLDSTPTILQADVARAYLGTSVDGAGDVNGDGYADVIGGAPLAQSSVADEGAAFLFFGGAAGVDPAVAWSFYGGSAGAECGWGVAGVGDTNADGYDEIAVGCPLASAPESAEGEALVFYGSASGPAAAPDWIFGSDVANGELGATLDALGDVNGDGYADMAVGGFAVDGIYGHEGRAYVFAGGTGGLATSPSHIFAPGSVLGDFGYQALGVDSDDDGRAELLVPAPDDGWLYAFVFTDADADGETSWTDCDDSDAIASHLAAESCDGVDNDCDDTIDEGMPTWYADADGDGAGNPAVSVASCAEPAGYVTDATDCDDADASVAASCVADTAATTDTGIVVETGVATDTSAGADTGAPIDTAVVVETGAPIDTGAPTETGSVAETGLVPDTGLPLDTSAPIDTSAPLDTSAPIDTSAAPDSGLPLETGLPPDTADTGLPLDTAETADSGDTGLPLDTADTADSGDTGLPLDTGDSGDTADTREPTHSGDGDPAAEQAASSCGCSEGGLGAGAWAAGGAALIHVRRRRAARPRS